MEQDAVRQETRWAAAWLSWVCALIVLVLLVGGITRLTHSGVSIVQWKPVSGVLPPIGSAAWQEEFERYQQFPQYHHLPGMTLRDFKILFFWEYLHRLIARLAGLIFAVPWIVFTIRRRLATRTLLRLHLAALLFAAQGALGWFMVKSGLVDRPEVSHLRLAAHLSTALLIYSLLLWTRFDLSTARPLSPHPRGVRALSTALVFLVGVQIVYGAFTAGLHAGLSYNSFPMMYGTWAPPELLQLAPGWSNFIDNPAAVQFTHRTLAWAILALTLAAVFLVQRGKAAPELASAAFRVLGAVGVQFTLGVATLLTHVSLPLAALHQLGACMVLAGALHLAHCAHLAPAVSRLPLRPPKLALVRGTLDEDAALL